MKIVKRLIGWTNGKKTFLGLALYFIIGGFKQIGFLNPDVLNQLILVADGLVAVGVIHKVKKAL